MGRASFRFLFVVGASGSGTTLLARVLSGVPGAVSLGGNHTTYTRGEPKSWAVVEAFDRATANLWDRTAPWERGAKARAELPGLLERLHGLPGQEGISHVVYKRSAPFRKGDRHRPDLSDLSGFHEDWRVIAIYRDPCASAYSSFRRRFGKHLRQCAVTCEEQLTYMAAQLATLPPASFLVVPYESLCAEPRAWAERLGAFSGLPGGALAGALERESLDLTKLDRWRRELAPADQRLLDSFFDARRRAQWPLLHQASWPAAVTAVAGA